MKSEFSSPAQKQESSPEGRLELKYNTHMINNQNVPKLRFKEFSGEWEEQELDNIAKFTKGKGVAKSDINDDGETECIRYGELYTHYNETINHIVSRTNLNPKGLVLSQYNDIIIPASGESQIDIATASCVLKDGVALGGDLNIIKTKQNGVFLSYYLNNKKKHDIAKLAQGISVVHLYSSQLKTLTLNLPRDNEQQKIASFLSAVDTKIDQLTRKKELLEQYKKAMMQKIFSQELRFKADDGSKFPEWEEKKLGEIATFLKGSGISKDNISENGNLECIRYGELYTYYKETIHEAISKTNLDKNGLVLSQKNDIIIPSSGETAIDLATASCVLKDGIALGGDLNIIRTQQNGVFLSYYLNNAKKIEIASLAQGSSVIHLYSTHLKVLKLQLPSFSEQTKIASFLSAIDTKIDLATKQLEEVKQFKKALLQQMFV